MPTLHRFFYSDSISDFIHKPEIQIFGILCASDGYDTTANQKDAWTAQIRILKEALKEYENGHIFFEFFIPRMGSRIDALLILNNTIFVIEFKVGEKEFPAYAIEQVWDYALDLKNFHKTSHNKCIAPVLVCTEAESYPFTIIQTSIHDDHLIFPIKTNVQSLSVTIRDVLNFSEGQTVDVTEWVEGSYAPTPTIIEAAKALYNNHTVEDITKKEADAINLSKTTAALDEIISTSKLTGRKAICFVTGVPGAGKTLVGLDIATRHMDKEKSSTSVFLSGNGPLVSILREALTRDRVQREKNKGRKIKKGEVLQKVKSFIQNVHHFRDEYLRDRKAPIDHVAIFDEAQRAWNIEQTTSFMKRKKGFPNFNKSEPEFLIECMNRHDDWAVIICLVGGGQEINTGEAGIQEWITSVDRAFRDWDIHISPHLTDAEYNSAEALEQIKIKERVKFNPYLHLSVSMRSFRAEHLSALIKCILDQDIEHARKHYQELKDRYPLIITRDLTSAKQWMKKRARGSERYGIVVSSQAQRLKPYAIDIRSPIDPVHWFLDGKDDVRSSYYLEDVATEFHVQGLELDWACVTWDGDFRYMDNGEWSYHEFRGDKWQRINKYERRLYLKNAYRVLLTRSRQGMVIVVPHGDTEDHTRLPEFYDSTFKYLESIGIPVI
jgi:hypothetical protein